MALACRCWCRIGITRSSPAWINDHHLGSRLVYYRVLAGVKPAPRPSLDPDVMPLYAALMIKEPSPFYGWLEAELFRRANYACVARP